MRLGASSLIVPAALGLPLLTLVAAQQPGENPHGDAQLDCARCHTAEAWTPVVKPKGFSHDATGFALEGVHAKVSCRDCHRTLVFSRVGTACADCHRDPHQGELGFRCALCHTPRSWATAQRSLAEVHARTGFPLTGVHAVVDCDACHRGRQPNQYTTTPTDCASCHLESFENARNPRHTGGGFSRACEGCHTTSGWRPATGIDHNKTRFPLTGAHQSVSCTRCHVGGRYAGTPTDCWSCHQADYNATTSPNHAAGGFPHTCEACHTTTAWQPAAFDHSKTKFPLTGAHAGVDCTKCHVGGRYAGTPTDCYSCHRTDYDGTTAPNHKAAGFPTSCETCHTTSAWTPASFDHNKTRFPLTGAHAGVDCAKCHAGGRYAGTPTDCYSCHQADYNGTNDPNHRAAGFPTTCQTCHTTSAWRPASFDHDRLYFPIYSGRHRGVWSSCSTCHTDPNNYRQFECINCHTHNKADTDSKHREVSGYQYNSQACYRCHPRGEAGGDLR